MTDDLTKINGVGPATIAKLNSRGIDSFTQIAALTDDQVFQLNEELDLRDNIINSDWRGQAEKLVGEQPKSDPEPKAGDTYPFRVNRDFWAGERGNAERIRKGTVIELPLEQAIDGVETGALSRVK